MHCDLLLVLASPLLHHAVFGRRKARTDWGGFEANGLAHVALALLDLGQVIKQVVVGRHRCVCCYFWRFRRFLLGLFLMLLPPVLRLRPEFRVLSFDPILHRNMLTLGLYMPVPGVCVDLSCTSSKKLSLSW